MFFFLSLSQINKIYPRVRIKNEQRKAESIWKASERQTVKGVETFRLVCGKGDEEVAPGSLAQVPDGEIGSCRIW